MALVDQVWLGNLSIDGAAVATCDLCATKDTTGLLGLNVTGGFNFFVDGDRQEVVFTSRFDRDNRLDVSPFIDLSATFTRFPGGRVEVVVNLANRSERTIAQADASIRVVMLAMETNEGLDTAITSVLYALSRDEQAPLFSTEFEMAAHERAARDNHARGVLDGLALARKYLTDPRYAANFLEIINPEFTEPKSDASR